MASGIHAPVPFQGFGAGVLIDHYLDGVGGLALPVLASIMTPSLILTAMRFGLSCQGGVLSPETEGVLVFHLDRVVHTQWLALTRPVIFLVR